MDRNGYFKRFKQLGWGDDVQSASIFNFLMDAREQVFPDRVLLDLGAGECRYQFFFEHCHYVSVDFGKGDTKWDFSKLDLIGDITKIDFIRDASVDFCLNTTTLEHLSEPSLFFAGVQRILRPGGRLFLYVPFVANEHQVPYDFFRYTSYGLRYLCEKNGLKVVFVNPSNGPLYTGIRWAYASLGLAGSSKIAVKSLLLALSGLFRFVLIPIFDRLEAYPTESDFPQCWLLVAEKEGTKTTSERPRAIKKQVIESIIWCPDCKGDLEFTNDSYLCAHCRKSYPVRKDQIWFLDQHA